MNRPKDLDLIEKLDYFSKDLLENYSKDTPHLKHELFQATENIINYTINGAIQFSICVPHNENEGKLIEINFRYSCHFMKIDFDNYSFTEIYKFLRNAYVAKLKYFTDMYISSLSEIELSILSLETKTDITIPTPAELHKSFYPNYPKRF